MPQTRRRGRTYYQWLRSKKNAGGLVGDLAQDAIGDRRMKAGFKTIQDLVSYLSHRGACDGAILAARESWIRWTRTGVVDPCPNQSD